MFSMSGASLMTARALLIGSLMAALVIAAPAAAAQPHTTQLNPEPPDTYICSATGAGTVCRASTSDPFELVPSGIWCGSGADAFEVLDSGGHDVRATRWYDPDGNLVRRLRVHDFPGAHFTNPLTGAELRYQQHNTDWDVLAVPGDFASSTFTGHGVLSITVPGGGPVIHEAGVTRVAPSGDVEFQAGPTDLSDYFAGDASVVADLCAALIAA